MTYKQKTETQSRQAPRVWTASLTAQTTCGSKLHVEGAGSQTKPNQNQTQIIAPAIYNIELHIRNRVVGFRLAD